MAHGVLGDLDQDGVAGLQRVLDPALLAFEVDGFPVDFTGVQHGVAAASDVNEGSFHGGQDVLDLAEVDVADQGVLLGLGDKVLGQDAVFQDADLDSVVALADDHLPVHGFAAGQELGLGDDGAAAAGVAGFAAALLLGFEPGGALDAGHAVVDGRLGDGARRADAGDRVGRIVVLAAGQFQVLVAAAAAAATAGRHAFVSLAAGRFLVGIVAVLRRRNPRRRRQLRARRCGVRPRRPRLRRLRRLLASSASPSSASSSSGSSAAAAGAGRTTVVRSGAWKSTDVAEPGSRNSEPKRAGRRGGVGSSAGAAAGAGVSAAAPAAGAVGAELLRVVAAGAAASGAAGACVRRVDSGALPPAAAAASGAATSGAEVLRVATRRRRTGFRRLQPPAAGASSCGLDGRVPGAAAGASVALAGEGGQRLRGALPSCGRGSGGRGPWLPVRSRPGDCLEAAAVSASGCGLGAASACCDFGGLRRCLTPGPGGLLGRLRGFRGRCFIVNGWNLFIIHMWQHSCP